jgi:DNA-binding transcriptional LysR family regulator
VLAAVRAGIGVAVMPSSLVPEDLKIITRALELPPVGDVDFTLIRNPLANAEVIDALTQAIMGRTEAPGPGLQTRSARERRWQRQRGREYAARGIL